MRCPKNKVCPKQPGNAPPLPPDADLCRRCERPTKDKSPKPSSKKARNLTLKDDDGIPTGNGDKIRFNYGIPPVVVIAKVVRKDNSLFALTPGHDPSECKLRSLRRYVGQWYKHDK